MFYIMNSGRLLELENMSEEDIHLPDIAHHLTKTCRYGGALPLNIHYSVAKHCLHLLEYAKSKGYNEHFQKCILMHDAAETYLGDIVAGLKCLLPDYKKLELKIEGIIKEKFDLYPSKEEEELIKDFDTRIALDEAIMLFPQHYNNFNAALNGKTPLGIDIELDYDKFKTYNTFLDECIKLGLYVPHKDSGGSEKKIPWWKRQDKDQEWIDSHTKNLVQIRHSETGLYYKINKTNGILEEWGSSVPYYGVPIISSEKKDKECLYRSTGRGE